MEVKRAQGKVATPAVAVDSIEIERERERESERDECSLKDKQAEH